MTVRISSGNGASERKIKPHKKSRKGCTNCKLRSVKCDESKPACDRCVAYGVSCSYSAFSPTKDRALLQLHSEFTTSITTLTTFSPPCFPDKHSEFLAKFRNRTTPTITAGGRVRLYQNEIVTLADSNSYLLNAIYALTILHDQQLLRTDGRQRPPEYFSSLYYSKAIKSFNNAISKALSHPSSITADQQAALWTTGSILSTISFCSVDATTPYEAWPLGAPSSTDLSWLKMSEGKKAVYELTSGLTTTDPIYAPLFEMHTGDLVPKPSRPLGLDRLPSGLLECYFNTHNLNRAKYEDEVYYESLMLLARVYGDLNLSPLEPVMSSARTSPTDAVSSLSSRRSTSLSRSSNSRTGRPFPESRLSSQPSSFIHTVLMFWTWTSSLTPHFHALLEQKEPKALLILACWWVEIYQTPVWWLRTRAKLEGLSICIYLETLCDSGPDRSVEGQLLSQVTANLKENLR